MSIKNLIKRFTKYELITGILCILLPFILIATNGGVLSSISAYAHSTVDFIYVFLLTIAGTLITVVGVRQNKRLIWIIGILLLFLPLTPYKDYKTIHLIASILFFIGISVDMIVDTQRLYQYRIFMVVTMVLAFVSYYILHVISLFWAESIAIIIFGVNFLLDLLKEKEDLEDVDVMNITYGNNE